MIRWGILGCGDVTEVKSGPALQKADRSTVVACMRRDAAKARDYADRHGIANSYASADALINDPNVNAVYVATPPSSHAELAIMAMRAGKPVLVEKPMAMNLAECDAMAAVASETGQSLVIAYYRRALPRFEKMRAIINDGLIGTPRCVMVHHLKQHDGNLQENWKTDPAIGGGGLFVDMQSHTLDWLDHTFGKALQVSGHARSQSGAYRAEDTVSFSIGYDPVVATGFCCYAAGQNEEHVKVFGSHGSVRMSFFAPSPILVDQGGVRTVHDVKDPAHVHQPFVERVIHHLLDGAPNPCPPDAARRSSAIIETLLSGVA